MAYIGTTQIVQNALPSWWTVDSTPGSENVDFAGSMSVKAPVMILGGPSVVGGITLNSTNNVSESLLYADDQGSLETQLREDGAYFAVGNEGFGCLSVVRESTTVERIEIARAAGKIGFYGTAPIVKQTGVAVTAAAIHAALVNLGLIAA